MTPADLAIARHRLGLTQAGLAIALRMGKHGGRTVRRWELGEVEVPGPVAVAVELIGALIQARAPVSTFEITKIKERLPLADERAIYEIASALIEIRTQDTF